MTHISYTPPGKKKYDTRSTEFGYVQGEATEEEATCRLYTWHSEAYLSGTHRYCYTGEKVVNYYHRDNNDVVNYYYHYF